MLLKDYSLLLSPFPPDKLPSFNQLLWFLRLAVRNSEKGARNNRVDLLGSEDASSGRVALTEGFLSLDFVNKGMYVS